MLAASEVKLTHDAAKFFFAAFATYADQTGQHEGALRSAYQNALFGTGHGACWILVPDLSHNANCLRRAPQDGSEFK